MADNILDRDKHPQWQGERTKMVYAFPTNEKLWASYAEIRAESLRNDGDGREATEFYRAEPRGDGCGAVVAWPERHNHDELSADPARDEPEAPGRGGLLRRVPERAAAGRDRPTTICSRPTRSPRRSTACSGARCPSAATT